MSIFPTLREIAESDEFDANLNVASGLKLFFTILSKNKHFKNAIKANKGNQELVEEIAIHIQTILDKKDTDLLADQDIPISAYLWILYCINSVAGSSACKRVLETTEGGLWWSKQVADRLRKNFDVMIARSLLPSYKYQIEQIEQEHKAWSAEQEKLPIMQRPMTGSYWREKFATVDRLRRRIAEIESLHADNDSQYPEEEV